MSDNKVFPKPMAEATSNIDRLEQRLQADWKHIKAARNLAVAKRAELRSALDGLDSQDTSIVVSGSLARDEFTEGSDIDWTLLIDGSADPRHYDLTARIKASVDRIAAKSTGAEGLFSTMVFSHDLIHQIGGDDDTNRNTTRRLLLLLESCAVGREGAHHRVIRNILNRYLLEDRGFWRGSQYRIPRFLQNDFARYWRTITVDFAYKLRTRSGKGSAIRNAKLRMSRKLIYVSGLLACFRCHLDHTADQWKEVASKIDRREQVVDYFHGIFRQTPLEIIASVLFRFTHLDQASRQVLDSYDEFLGILANPEARKRLETITEDLAASDEVFLRARSLSHAFRDGLLAIFFDTRSGLDELTKNHGVF
jgi:predicted nucleotidyltransferase